MIKSIEELIYKTKSKVAITIFVCDKLVDAGWIKDGDDYIKLYNLILGKG